MLAALGLALALASPSPSPSRGVASVRRYFAAWNERDMALAADQFAEGCTYDDTQYNEPFTGKEALVRHLLRVADALPPSFQFCIDEVADGGDTIGVQWHVENSGVPLPFTRGCSMYKACGGAQRRGKLRPPPAPPSVWQADADGKLVSGFDVPEPAPFKPGSASLLLLSVASKLIQEPARAVPLAAWVGYVTIVFFSNGILPGPDATQLDGATWVEVRDLSLNFWLVAPLLNLPFAPTVHPGLEAIFNWLLAWAAAFGGFLSDGRPGRSAGTTSNSMLPVLAGMQAFFGPTPPQIHRVRHHHTHLSPPLQRPRTPPPTAASIRTMSTRQFLTNAVLLPYLVTRPASPDTLTYVEDIGAAATIGESKPLGPILAAVGTAAIGLGSSFVVDLVLFALFQGWLVDDDLRRRGVDPESAGALRWLAKGLPFWGLCAYLTVRPSLPARGE
ncbi:hypothetical protein AB1Y20_004299 [Prymnesium parvum]|uniref:SnoaL-like domain-containing protein n=1 Tax=Prymnesium parvum TaxID=97485 RepID=A0AB34IXS1_PRYPA